MNNLEIKLWSFIDGDISTKEFEDWICTDESMEAIFGGKFYFELLNGDYRNRYETENIKEKIKDWVTDHFFYSSPIKIIIKKTSYKTFYGHAPEYSIKVGHCYDVFWVDFNKGRDPNESVYFRIIDNDGFVSYTPIILIEKIMTKDIEIDPSHLDILTQNIPSEFILEKSSKNEYSLIPAELNKNYFGKFSFWEDFYGSNQDFSGTYEKMPVIF